MRKFLILLFSLICILSMTGCSRTMDDIIETAPSVTGIVEEVYDNSVLIYCEHLDGYLSGEHCRISLEVEYEDSYTTPSVGDEIIVYHNGDIAESDPLQINTVYAITLKTPADEIQTVVFYDKCQNDVAGTVTFYTDPIKEAQNSKEPVTVRCCVELNEEHASEINRILDRAYNWTDDRLVDRLPYYFDGNFELADREDIYYFTYEYNVIYYDHYFAEISDEDMKYIRDLGAECVELPDIEATE